MKYIGSNIILLIVVLMVGCAGQIHDYETPKVNVSSFKSLPSEGTGPRFEIGLHIINPNRSPLELQGVAYTLHLEGHEVMAGVSNQLPVIAAYGEENIIIHAGIDLLGSIRLIMDLMSKRRNKLSYSLKAKLDPGGLRPNIHVSREGTIMLSGNNKESYTL
jgi:LEA14-like dessication related protein